MRSKREFQQHIERCRSRLALTGLAHGALSGAIILVAIIEFWLSPSSLRFNKVLCLEIIIGGFIGGLLG
ncbi:MAG TPA: hypothetical protein VIQ24_10955, partial [Pyrinomonadaceae bacterium]